MKPNKYIVRIWMEDGGYDLRPWAFTAEDAKFQVEIELKKSFPQRAFVTYVGPLNPDCKCLNQCRCGMAAQ